MANKLNSDNINTWLRFFVVVGITHIIMLTLVVYISTSLSTINLELLDPVLLTSKEKSRLLLVVSLLLTFILTKYAFQHYYPKLASSVSSDLPQQIGRGELWLSWTFCFWSAVLLYGALAVCYLCLVPTLDIIDIILGSPGVVFASLSVGVTVYLYLKYLATRDMTQR